jgi:coenzyme F420-reducing hydrogenase delta subunit
LKGFLEHIGIEPGRLHFSWVASSESTKFVEVARRVTDQVKALGPAENLVKGIAKVG